MNPLDLPSRHLILGNENATLNHVYLVYHSFSIDRHGLQDGDIKREDRQNWRAAQRLASRKVQLCLQQLQQNPNHRKERTKGTELYLQITALYIDIFLSPHMSLFERVKATAKVSFYFRLWKLWLHLGVHMYNLATNFISRQTYLAIQLSCHYSVLLIKLFRDRHCHLEVPLSLTSSDACEIFFSKVGGMNQNEQNYDGCDLVESVEAIARIAEFEANPKGPQFARAHKKQTHIWTELEKNSTLSLANLGDYVGLESDDQIISTLKLGFIKAQMLCAELGMKPAKVIMKSWWEQPWIHERKLEKELFSSIEEEECDFVHIHDATTEEGGICGNGQVVTGASSSSTKAERGEVSQLINDQVEVAGLESELRHVLDDVLDEHEGC